MTLNRQKVRQELLSTSGKTNRERIASAGVEKVVDLHAIRDAYLVLQTVNLSRYRNGGKSDRWAAANAAIKQARTAVAIARDAVREAIENTDDTPSSAN